MEVIAADPEFGAQVLAALDRIETRLAEEVRSSDPLIEVTASHLLKAGGKRVRPLLTVLAGAIGGGINDDVIDAAVVVELTHLASLYHDDVMDSAPVRRGVDAAHTVWGNNVAILTGDLIFARASALVATLSQRAYQIQANAFERLVTGQLQETSGPPEGTDALEHYIQVLAGKTGSLIAACGVYGSTLAGATPEVIEVLENYGEKIGVAFQLADDVIDITSTAAQTGKTPGTDLREGVPTLPVLVLRRMAAGGDTSAQEVLALVDGDLTADEDLARAVEALAGHPAIDGAWEVAESWVNQAEAALAPLPESTAKRALQSFARGMVHRSA
ncbi:polyprenyl synthetase family protein [Kocuria sp. JC486]|uniref:polyprenyl synthetase family protein n=1 Tax=Kocuria sp. JC486 TaxID=1970736 RepID=UPI001422D062|nr:polyprenyl synthetase family protein [Kocuria sp. JC486]NHU84689.1 polyprenyl synthetase family protein [Kocuria sp. JC486]